MSSNINSFGTSQRTQNRLETQLHEIHFNTKTILSSSSSSSLFFFFFFSFLFSSSSSFFFLRGGGGGGGVGVGWGVGRWGLQRCYANSTMQGRQPCL